MSCHHQEQNLPHNSVKTIRTVEDNKISEKKCYGRKYRILLLQVEQEQQRGRQRETVNWEERRSLWRCGIETESLSRCFCCSRGLITSGSSVMMDYVTVTGAGARHMSPCHILPSIALPSIHYHNIAGHGHSLPTLPTHLGSIHDVMIPEPT